MLTSHSLKKMHEQANPTSRFFARSRLAITGDSMANFGVRNAKPMYLTASNTFRPCYVLYRKKPTKLSCNEYFDAITLQHLIGVELVGLAA